MLSFRSILFAAAAFATMASAIPTPDTSTNALGGLTSREILPVGLTAAPAKRGEESWGDIVKTCHDDVAVVVVKISQFFIIFR
jgi:hypothetical protein